MLGRKREFRPDRVGSGFLNKLYLTQRQRRSLLMWLLYTLALVALSLVLFAGLTVLYWILFGIIALIATRVKKLLEED